MFRVIGVNYSSWSAHLCSITRVGFRTMEISLVYIVSIYLLLICAVLLSIFANLCCSCPFCLFLNYSFRLASYCVNDRRYYGLKSTLRFGRKRYSFLSVRCVIDSYLERLLESPEFNDLSWHIVFSSFTIMSYGR